jgi:hypothetical protein
MGDIKEILNKISYLVSEHDKRIDKNEKMIYNAFSYLYNKMDELTISINNINNIYNTSTNTKDINIPKEKNVVKSKNKINEVKEEPIKKKKKHKRKRPFFYFITKHFKYKKLIEEKLIIENEIEVKRKAIEEYRKKEEIRRQTEFKKNTEKLKTTRSQINKILKPK